MTKVSIPLEELVTVSVGVGVSVTGKAYPGGGVLVGVVVGV